MADGERSAEDAAAFLAAHHGVAVTGLERLRGGFWSTAFGYHADGRELVARFGRVHEGFEMDRLAAAWTRPDLPIPEVLTVGPAFDGWFAISVRHHGQFLEEIDPGDAPAAGPALERTLAALRTVPAPLDAPSTWYPHDLEPSTSTWRGWLLGTLVDDPRRPMSGWRALLAADPAADRLFRACERRIKDLVEACPERRDLVHGDLLHQNVLLDEACDRCEPPRLERVDG